MAPVDETCKLMKIASRKVFAVAARSSYEGLESSLRVITARYPSRSSSARRIFAIWKTTSFSTKPLAPRAPVSVPP